MLTLRDIVAWMSEREVLERIDSLSRLLARAIDLLRDLRSDIVSPKDHRRGQIEQWLYEAEEVLQ